jgi:hypothetical protein
MEIKLGGKYNSFLFKRKIGFQQKVNKYKKDKTVIVKLSFSNLQLIIGRKKLNK